jgi:hypothetical protein
MTTNSRTTRVTSSLAAVNAALRGAVSALDMTHVPVKHGRYEIEVSLVVRLTVPVERHAELRDAEMLPDAPDPTAPICCICARDTAGRWWCSGSCCPA